jgi:hypothetical protein
LLGATVSKFAVSLFGLVNTLVLAGLRAHA